MDQNQVPTPQPNPQTSPQTPPQPNDQSNQTQPTPQPTEKVSFWKSKDPAIVVARIVIYIFVGIPLLGIIFAILLAVLSAARRIISQKEANGPNTALRRTQSHPADATTN